MAPREQAEMRRIGDLVGWVGVVEQLQADPYDTIACNRTGRKKNSTVTLGWLEHQVAASTPDMVLEAPLPGRLDPTLQAM